MLNDDESYLRKAERKLYTTDNEPPHKRSLIHDTFVDTPSEWATPASNKPLTPMNKKIITPKFFKKIFLGSLVFLAIACAILVINFLTGVNGISAKNVQVTITTKSFVDGGEEFPINVAIVNRNKVNLELASLVLEYPEGGVGVGAPKRLAREIGTIGVGDTHQESFTVQLYGEEGSQREITATIEFRVAGSNAVYDQTTTSELTIRNSPVQLTLSAPESVIPNQEIPLKFSITGNGVAVLNDTAFIVNYPPGFTFIRAEPSPSSGSNVWYLGDVPPGANRTITIFGSLTGGVNELKTIRASIGLQNKRNEQELTTIYNSLSQVISLSNAFINAQILVGTKSDPVIPISPTSQISINIPWQNTLSSRITNAEISVRLSGSAYDPTRVQPVGGFFDTANNKIVWTRQQDLKLGTIDPGDSGTVSFTITPKQSLGSTIINPVILLAVDIKGVQAGGELLNATDVDTKKLVVNSDLNLITRTLHYSGPIQNSGPMPPVPNTETTYTIEWEVTNFRNRVTGVSVGTILPLAVSWKDVVIPQSEIQHVSYNTITREIVWNVGDVPPGTGASLPSKTLSMKIGFTPGANKVGSLGELTDEITVSGIDDFTKSNLSFTRRLMNTRLLNDGNGPGTRGIIGGE